MRKFPLSDEELREVVERDKACRPQQEKDNAWLRANYSELRGQYPDQWVAVYEEQIVMADSSQDRLIRRLRRKGIDPTLVVMAL